MANVQLPQRILNGENKTTGANTPKTTRRKKPRKQRQLTDNHSGKINCAFFPKMFLQTLKRLLYLHPHSRAGKRFIGGMAEWSIAAVLKTVDCNRSGGSNPSSSAKRVF